MPRPPRAPSHPRSRRAALVASLLVAATFLMVSCAPRAVTRAAARMWPGCLYEAPGMPRERVVALTIDDTPDLATTPPLLDTLAAYGARATFFTISGRMRGADSLLARLRGEGHEVGNHFTSSRATIRLDSAAFERDLATAHDALIPYGPLRWARPGSGWYSQRMVRQLRRAGYACALGSVYPLDAELPWAWMAERYVLGHVRPGAVIILHDRGGRGRRTARVLGHVLPELRRRGYRVVTLSELVP